MREHPFNAIGGVSAALLLCVGSVRLTAADPETLSPGGDQAVTPIKTPHEILTRQKLPNFVGISAQTARGKGLSMNLDAGTHFQRHTHWGGEEILVLEGEFGDEHGRYPEGTWIRSPHMSQHSPFSESGCPIYVRVGGL